MLRRLLHALGRACAQFAAAGTPTGNRAERRGAASMLDRAQR